MTDAYLLGPSNSSNRLGVQSLAVGSGEPSALVQLLAPSSQPFTRLGAEIEHEENAADCCCSLCNFDCVVDDVDAGACGWDSGRIACSGWDSSMVDEAFQ